MSRAIRRDRWSTSRFGYELVERRLIAASEEAWKLLKKHYPTKHPAMRRFQFALKRAKVFYPEAV